MVGSAAVGSVVVCSVVIAGKVCLLLDLLLFCCPEIQIRFHLFYIRWIHPLFFDVVVGFGVVGSVGVCSVVVGSVVVGLLSLDPLLLDQDLLSWN